jgi:glucose-1-phosphate adenylyltransferase
LIESGELFFHYHRLTWSTQGGWASASAPSRRSPNRVVDAVIVAQAIPSAGISLECVGARLLDLARIADPAALFCGVQAGNDRDAHIVLRLGDVIQIKLGPYSARRLSNRDNSGNWRKLIPVSDVPLIPPTDRTMAIIMGGGAGTRLFPLTKERAKPAVPLGGKYRLVDIPISNCLNSGIRCIYVLTQFNSMSLHRHINAAFRFDNFTPGFCEILAAQQTPEGSHWYQGTADAVRQNLRYFLGRPVDYYVILSGDQLYRMDYRQVLRQHLETDADLTVGTIPVDQKAATGFGIVHTDEKRRIVEFIEKPKDPQILDSLRIPADLLQAIGQPTDADLYQASMGIYVFKRNVLAESLDNHFADFGKNIIPAAIEKYKVQAYVFQGYWEDIGTIGAFFEASLDLADPNSKFSFNESGAPVYTHARFLPASIVRSAQIDRSLICDGCLIEKATIEHSIIGIRSIVGEGAVLKNVILMGADYYEANLEQYRGVRRISELDATATFKMP